MHDNVFHIVREINYFILFYFIYLATRENRLNSISEHHLITNVPPNDLERERGGGGCSK